MEVTYHCIPREDEWEIKATEAGKAVDLPKTATDFRTRDRERAVLWMTDQVLHDGECNRMAAGFEAESMIQDAELELAKRLWEEAGAEKRQAWCDELEVEPPRSADGLGDLPLLVEEMLDPLD